MTYVAAKPVALGTGKEDPDRPGRQGVKVFETGEVIDVPLENPQALVDNGYLMEEGGEDE